jgi:hypothetical protein
LLNHRIIIASTKTKIITIMNAITILVNTFPPNPAVMSRLEKKKKRTKKQKAPPSLSSSSSPYLAAIVTPTSLMDDSATWKAYNLATLDRPNIPIDGYERRVDFRDKSRTTHGLVELGRGSFGVVYKMKRKGVNMAIKIIHKESLFDDYRRELLCREISIQKK